ncbi:SDR family oxidoreductase [Spirosoma flavus]
MQILVVGATGGTGLQAVEQSLQRGYYVTAFVRDPAKLAIKHPNLTILIGDVLKPDTLLPAVRRQDAVFCALGSRPGQQSQAVTDGTKNLIDAMQQVNVRRLLVVSSLGVGTSYEEAPWLSKLVISTFLKGAIDEKEEQEAFVRQSNLDWTIARPTSLTNGPLTHQLRVGEHLPFPRLVMPRISRADVADFLLNRIESDTYLHKAVTITGR